MFYSSTLLPSIQDHNRLHRFRFFIQSFERPGQITRKRQYSGTFFAVSVLGWFDVEEPTAVSEAKRATYAATAEANPHDAALCLLFGQNAVHAGMADRTGMVVVLESAFTHVLSPLAISARKKVDPESWLWSSI